MNESFEQLFKDDIKRATLSVACLASFRIYIQTMFYALNRKGYVFKPFHNDIIKKLEDIVYGRAKKPNLLLNLPVGCVSGETIIRMNRCKLGRKIKIETAYNNLKKISPNWKYHWSDKETFVRSEKNGEIRLMPIEDIVYSGIKETYTLHLEDGKTLRATKEHQVLTINGYKPLIDLTENDMVAVDNLKKGGNNKHIKIQDTYFYVGKKHPYVTNANNLRVEIHRAIYEAHINNMTLGEYKKACYAGTKLKYIDTSKYVIHHKDGNHFNNDIGNLELLTIAEHNIKHNIVKNFGQGKITYSNVIKVEKYGFEKTYDIVCKKRDDEPNFTANGIIVHNSGKSLLVELFITWCFARGKQSMFCYISHSSDLISKLSRETKEIVESPEWISLFGHKIKKDEKSKMQYSFENAGSRTGLTAASMGSAITGVDAGNPNINGFAGALIIDDPLDAGNAKSKVAKEDCIRIYTDKLKTRLRTNTTPIIVIMQRLALDDLSAYILENELKDFEVVTVKALNEDGKSYWEDKISTEKLIEMSKNPSTVGLFNSQYQQNPISENGNFFKRDMFEEADLPKRFDYTYVMADTAYKDKQENDYTVFTAFGVYNKDLYIIDILREKIKSVDIENKCIPFIQEQSVYGFRGAFIEPKGHGIYLNQKLPTENIVMPRAEDIEKFFRDRTQDKQQRANASMPFFTNHKIYINREIEEKTKSEAITECVNFPDGLHDDFVDTVVDGVKYYMEQEMLKKPFNPKF